MSVQKFIKPEKHILWVNDEGRYRQGHWWSWQSHAEKGTWLENLANLIKNGQISVKMLTFPSSPPGNPEIYVSNSAHRSDFVRLAALKEYGGIYLDTDVFAVQSIESLRIHEFTMSYDNVVDIEKPKRLNNGVILSTRDSVFLSMWSKEYRNFDPKSWDLQSSIIPFNLAVTHPDLIHIEWSRLSPISFGFQTSEIAAALTCGILNPVENTITYPVFDTSTNEYTFIGANASKMLYKRLDDKLVWHLTMSQVR
jgi:hypothetical protein